MSGNVTPLLSPAITVNTTRYTNAERWEREAKHHARQAKIARNFNGTALPRGYRLPIAWLSVDPSAVPLRLRLADALTQYPECELLLSMATLDPADGELLDCDDERGIDSLRDAFMDGAPAELIDRAYRVRKVQEATGPAGTERWFRLTFRLARTVAHINRRLRYYTGRRRTLSTATHRGRNRQGLSVRETDAVDQRGHTIAAAVHLLGDRPASPTRGHDPPPRSLATTAPILRTGPPAIAWRGCDQLTRAPGALNQLQRQIAA